MLTSSKTPKQSKLAQSCWTAADGERVIQPAQLRFASRLLPAESVSSSRQTEGVLIVGPSPNRKCS